MRDKTRPDKVDHILAINEMGFSGSVELWEADLGDIGSYDAAFAGCAGVLHMGAVMGRPGADKETPQEVYDGSFTDVAHVWESAVKAGSVKRFVQASSLAAVVHGPPNDYEGEAKYYMRDHIFDEDDWTGQADGSQDPAPELIPTDRNIAYAAAKKAAEHGLYKVADTASFEACAIHPTHVLGPLKAVNNDDFLSWQWVFKEMLKGEPMQRSPGGRMLWNICDVRDCAAVSRLALENPDVVTGDRFLVSAYDETGEPATHELQDILRGMYPGSPIGKGGGGAGEEVDEAEFGAARGAKARCLKAMSKLGLEPIDVHECIRATADSYIELGLLDESIRTASKM